MGFDGAFLAAASFLACSCAAFAATTSPAADGGPQVRTRDGIVAGAADPATGVRSFKGVPFAAPPVGDLRWRPPQPAARWDGVRPATAFGPRATQPPIFGDMNFRSAGMCEDCLYLNVWTPNPTPDARLPVLVYFYGGGFVAGDGSEPRYDGASMAARGIVAVTVNYRLGVFGFLAHPELTAESPDHASGNYGLLDQLAALRWVNANIAAFGGDPARVTIAGESAGSVSVSAQMASPLAKGLFARAIGESGSLIGTLTPIPLKDAEAAGAKFAADLGAPTLAQLRALPAERLLKAPGKPGDPWTKPIIDGHFLPKEPRAIYAAGEQSHVPLLAGVNSAEGGASAILKDAPPTLENYRAALARLYGEQADAAFAAYPATNEDEVLDAARDLASDRFISYGTWTWTDLATRTGGQPTYYYVFTKPRPPMRPEMGDATPGLAGGVIRGAASTKPAPLPTRGAVHSAEIEYALGNLDGNHVYAWTADDREASRVMQAYFAAFIEKGDPNVAGLPTWPTFASGGHLILDVTPRAEPTDRLRSRYDAFATLKPRP